MRALDTLKNIEINIWTTEDDTWLLRDEVSWSCGWLAENWGRTWIAPAGTPKKWRKARNNVNCANPGKEKRWKLPQAMKYRARSDRKSHESLNRTNKSLDSRTMRSNASWKLGQHFFHILDAFSHLTKRVCPSVRPSIPHELKPCKSAVFDQY